ncbi:prepilin peptidase [Proteiniclasticum sp.]|uniref:prepilin peptidase n=1 Tax=Proteiniclasticum sp. TaxID=2053595 RepID=UPI0028A1260C|nr:prepilin peptidase [Proteiniclasticum sp.]
MSILLPVIGGLSGVLVLRDTMKSKMELTIPFIITLSLASLYFRFSIMEIIFYSVFLSSAVTDAHSGRVYNVFLYLMAPSALYLFYETRSYIAGVFMILIPIYRSSRKLQFYFGEGDLWILLFISMAFGRNVFYTLFYASCLGLIFSLVRMKREVYFVPFLFLGLLISQIEIINNLFGI